MAEIDFQTFSRKLVNAGNALKVGEAKIVLGGATALASDVSSAYRRASGGDGRLSGTGKARRGTGKAATVGARAKPDVRRYANNVDVGLVVPTGAYGLLERDIAPHKIEVYRPSANRIRRTLKAARKASGDGSRVQATRIARAQLAARTASALRTGGGKTGYAMSANHPGTKGKDVFSSAVRAAAPKVLGRMLTESEQKIVNGYRSGT